MKEEFFDDMNEALENLKKSREEAMKLLFDEKPQKHNFETNEILMPEIQENSSSTKQGIVQLEQENAFPEQNNTVVNNVETTENNNGSVETNILNNSEVSNESVQDLNNSNEFLQPPVFESQSFVQEEQTNQFLETDVTVDHQTEYVSPSTENTKPEVDTQFVNAETNESLNQLRDSKKKAFDLLFGVEKTSEQHNMPNYVEEPVLETIQHQQSEVHENTDSNYTPDLFLESQAVENEILVEETVLEEVQTTNQVAAEPMQKPKSKVLYNTFALNFGQQPLFEDYREMTNENTEQIDRLLDYVNFLEKRFSIDENNPLDRFILNEPRLKIDISNNNQEINDLAVKSTSFDIDLVTENMAKIYFKQGNKEKAIEIYKRLSLKNPQKMTYFAEKISEIENQF